MNALGVGPSIILYHIFPTILGSLIYLLLAQLFIFIFRIKKPSHKYIIYVLALYKTVILLITGARYSTTFIPRKAFGFGVTFYDPLDLLPFSSTSALTEIKKIVFLQSPLLGLILSLCIAIIAVMLILRWIGTALYFNKIINDEKAIKTKTNLILDRLSAQFKVKTPILVLSSTEIGPLTIGVMKPAIILPKNLLSKLSEEEIEVIIGHELAHIKRHDNFWQWIILFIKDVLFFSPFSRLVYKMIQINKEIAADKLFVKFYPDKNTVLKKTIAKISNSEFLPKSEPKLLTAKANFINLDIIEKRLEDNLQVKKDNSNILKTFSAYAGITIFFWLKAWIAINLVTKSLMILS